MDQDIVAADDVPASPAGDVIDDVSVNDVSSDDDDDQVELIGEDDHMTAGIISFHLVYFLMMLDYWLHLRLQWWTQLMCECAVPMWL